MNSHERRSLDRYITGNYGEDQFRQGHEIANSRPWHRREWFFWVVIFSMFLGMFSLGWFLRGQVEWHKSGTGSRAILESALVCRV